jgi:hypothetical protein
MGQAIADGIEQAKAELAIEMHQFTAQSIHDAKARAQAEKELADLQGLLAMNGGQTKTVKLMHKEAGKVLGAVVTERVN